MKFEHDYQFEDFINEEDVIYNDETGQYVKKTESYIITVNKWNKRVFIDVLVSPINLELIDIIQKYYFIKYDYRNEK